MANLEIEVTGLAELERQLMEVAGPGARRALTKGLRQGTNVILKEARQRVRKRTGRTAKVTQTKSEGLQGQDITFAVRTDYIGRFLELGTSRMPAYPFLRPAMDAKKSEAVDQVVKVTLAAIEAEVAKR